MNFSELFFSFEGRIPRATWWKVSVAFALLGIFANVIDISLKIYPVISVIWSLIALYPGLAVSAKRLHDRGKSAWWLLLSFVPVIGAIWLFVELGFLSGEGGHNLYGPNPLGSSSTSKSTEESFTVGE